MEVIEIPATVLLQEMLKKLDLPSPIYANYMSEEAQHVSSVTFYPSTDCIGYADGTIALTGYPEDTQDAANNEAAKQAIKYMEKTQKIMKDYTYNQLQEAKLIEMGLNREATYNNKRLAEIIKEKDQKIKMMTKHWKHFIQVVGDMSTDINKIAHEGYSPGSSELHNDMNSTLWQVQQAAAHLDHLAFESIDILQKLSKCPYETTSDCDEDSQFEEHYPASSSQFEGSSPSPPYSTQNFCLDEDALCDIDDLYSMASLHL